MLKFNLGISRDENWIIEEASFNERYQGKCESIMALGNGYMGLRSACEEPYIGQTRNLFIAGTYNKFTDEEVTELPNAADVTEMIIYINDEPFSLKSGRVHEYSRKLNLKTGETTRSIVWENDRYERYMLTFRRYVSLDDLHLIGMKTEIVPLSCNASVAIKTGINGRQTNSGVQHFHDRDKRVYDKKYMQLVQTTLHSNIDFVFSSRVKLFVDDNELENMESYSLERRSIYQNLKTALKKGEKLTLEKFTCVFTSLDNDTGIGKNPEGLKMHSLEHITQISNHTYEILLKKSQDRWQKYWSEVDVEIQSKNSFDQLVLRFAQYHLLIMTPYHDDRFSVGAKALTGEGYKGHVFWDTEIFILPYFQYTFPDIARKLLKYRFDTIKGALNKAEKFGYKGAMYPWETAFTGEEETPEWAAINIMTGKATRIWSGIKEHHITADIAYAVWNYYLATDDEDFMNLYGSEIVFQCAEFWYSRLTWAEDKKEYHIKDIIGPDEYTEHIDNNAYTNYLAHFVIKASIELYELGRRKNWSNYGHLRTKLSLDERIRKYESVINLIYLPKQNEAGVIPQDDTFMSKACIDLEKYKNSDEKQTILHDYTRAQVIDLQVLKQADVVMLLYLLRSRFGKNVKKANWEYYEKRTIHDSSLSAAVHSIVANDFDFSKGAYSFFKKASEIDLGPNPISSNEGIHAASMGGIWLAAVMGFGGIWNDGGVLHINPKLPEEWERLKFSIWWKGEKLNLDMTNSRVEISKISKLGIDVCVKGNRYTLYTELVIE